jgi:Rieske 2Fe-2S family protein
VTIRSPDDVDQMKFKLYRQPIGLGRSTISRDGTPVARLMGGFTSFDGGETAMHFGRQCFAGGYNDHVILFQFTPRGPEEADVLATWLVDAEADVDAVDVDALTFMWDVTTRQGKQLIEENAAGVRSRAYRPGLYTALESQSSQFVQSYVDAMRKLLAA